MYMIFSNNFQLHFTLIKVKILIIDQPFKHSYELLRKLFFINEIAMFYSVIFFNIDKY